MSTLCLIIARMGSTRLPGKVLLPILGRPLLELMLERVRRSRRIDRILLATTDLPEDDLLAAWAAAQDIGCFRGSNEDVLGRIGAAVAAEQPELVVELLGDNPFVDGQLIDDVVDHYQAGGFDYVASVTTEYPHAPPEIARFPLGVRVQVFSPTTLARCVQLVSSPTQREHATSFIAQNPEQFNVGYFPASGSWASASRPALFLAVNDPTDLARTRRIFEQLYPGDAAFGLSQVVRFCDGLLG